MEFSFATSSFFSQSQMTSIWLPVSLATLAFALLGLLVYRVLRQPFSERAAPPHVNKTDADLDRLKRAGDRVSLLTAAAEQAADALDERIEQLQGLLAIADDSIEKAQEMP